MTEQLVVQLEGEYNYVEKERNYCQETFKLVLNTENNHYIVLSEIFSRMDSGELLKINVRYEMNQYYFPINVKITRSLGKKFAQETFFLDTTSQTLRYHFQNDTRDQNFSMPATTKHYITSPSFATSALFTLSRKFDATGRTAVSMITSKNIWDYVAPPEDQIIYADFKTRELTDFKINKTELSAMLLHLYQGDSNSPYHEEPTQIYLSKHYNIPYQLIHGDQQILVKSLKKIS
jgi:hypothetical protein